MTETHAEPHKHPYHLVDPSPWPIVGAIAAGVLTAGAVVWFHGGPVWIWPLGFLCLVLATMFLLVARRDTSRRPTAATTHRW